MKKGWRLTVVVLLLTVVVGLFLVITRPDEPSYQGRSLSAWLDDNYQSKLMPPRRPVAEGTRERAENAIKMIGTNAIPTLLRMLASRDSRLKLEVLMFAHKQSLIPVPWPTARERHLSASFVFLVLGAIAKPAQPGLMDLISNGDPDVRTFAGIILKQLDPDYELRAGTVAAATPK